LPRFRSRFSLGFFAATITCECLRSQSAFFVGPLTSIPDAIVTKAYGPILKSQLAAEGRVKTIGLSRCGCQDPGRLR